MTLLLQSLGFGILFGLVMLLANHDKPSKLLILLKYFLIGTGGYFLYHWIMNRLFS
ncbi:hypothetical protein [Bacillus cihuensis]|uniref:hypothetical protein n=1 Tax=Bacillus cihuensis TaxID=1208599 RepID=UPI0003FDF5A4|nr:hypothetical protein [Bacillus cihuensis]